MLGTRFFLPTFELLIECAARRLSAVSTVMKGSLTFAVSLLVGALKAFVLMLMWNWFV